MAHSTLIEPLQSRFAAKPERIIALDLVRGIALIVIFIDHLEWLLNRPLVSTITLKAIGCADCADLFVFISGYVVFKAYDRRHDRQGFWACQRHALGRTLQVYTAYVCALLTVAVLLARVPSIFAPVRHNVAFAHAVPGIENPLLLGILGLTWQPYGFEILPLYIVLLPLAPLWVAFLKRGRVAAVTAAAAIYIFVQFRPTFNLPTDDSGNPGWFFNPGAWQLVFVLGMLASNTGFATNLTKRQRWVIGGIALFLMLAFAIYRFCPLPREALGNRWEECLAWIYPSRNFFSKTINGPLRLLNASAVIIIVFCWILPSASVCKRGVISRALALNGQHSLAVYAASLVFLYLAPWWIRETGKSAITVLLFEINSALALCAIAWMIHRMQQYLRKATRAANEMEAPPSAFWPATLNEEGVAGRSMRPVR